MEDACWHISIKMKHLISEKILIPEGISCQFHSKILKPQDLHLRNLPILVREKANSNLDGFKTEGFDSAQNSANFDMLKEPENTPRTSVQGFLTCSNNKVSLEEELNLPNIEVKVSSDSVILECKKGNKNDYKKIKSAIANINNLFSGLNEKFVYKLEACNVHFPMTLKTESKKLTINNFLGEKTSRVAVILPNVDVEVKGTQITVSSNDRDAAGQTAANMEKATKVKARDRRIYQDGIFITSKPGRKI